MREIAATTCVLRQYLYLVIVFLLVSATNSQKSNVCRTPECIKISKTILSEMDPTADPCEDMYQYACGGWLKVNRTAENKFDEAEEDITRLTIKNLRDESPTIGGNFSKSVYKAQTFFKNCMDLKTIDELGTKPLIKLINQLGSWTVVECDGIEPWVRNEWDFEETLAKIYKTVSVAIPFWELKFESSSKHQSKIVFYLKKPPLTLKSKRSYANETIERHREAYLEYAAKFGELLGGSREIIIDKMKKVFVLEQRLAEISDDDTFYADDLQFKYTTLAGVQNMFGDLIDLEDYLSKVFSRQILNSSDLVVIWHPKYFEIVADVIRETDKEVLANYMIWSVITLFPNYLPESFGNAFAAFDTVLNGHSPPRTREDLCSMRTLEYFGIANSAIIIDKYYDLNTTHAVRSLLDGIQHEFIQNLDNVTWLDDETRLAVREKAEAMRKFIGFPEVLRSVEYIENYFKDFDVKPGQYFDNFLQYMAYSLKLNSDKLGKYPDQNEWHWAPTTTQAWNMPELNAVFFPLGFLRYPLFSLLYPKPYYYGGIGTIGGHEFTHGFDTYGMHYTKTGEYTSQWWTNATLDAFKNVTSCFVDFFGKYEVQGIKFNGARILGENIADSGGLKYAYRAFKAAKSDDDFTLPDLELSPDQLFFLGFSQNWCFKLSPEYERTYVLDYAHALPRFRVLGTVSNNKEFAKAFKCKPNSRLNPVNKCEVW